MQQATAESGTGSRDGHTTGDTEIVAVVNSPASGTWGNSGHLFDRNCVSDVVAGDLDA